MSDDAAELWPEALHLAHVIAVARDATGGSVVSHESAGVVWGCRSIATDRCEST